jgi:hypothetical protein
MPLTVKILPAPPDAEKQAGRQEQDGKEKAETDRKLALETERIADFTKWLAEFSAGLFVVAIAQAGLFAWQLRYMRSEIDRAEKTFLFGNRPKLEIKFVEWTLVEDKIAITFSIVNSGTSAARVTESAAHVGVFEPNDWTNPNDYGLNSVIQDRRFLPGATDRYTVVAERAGLFDAYASGSSQVRLYGYVVYCDDADNPRTTYFCRVHDRDRDRFVPPDNPDYDSTD